MLVSGLSEGQHVVAARDLAGWMGPFGSPSVRKGTRGIVRAHPTGIFNDRYEVEFMHGARLRVSRRHLRPALYGHGDEAWARYRANRAGIRLGMAVLMLPLVFEIVTYYLRGGTTAGLISAVPGAIACLLLDVASRLVSLVGLPILVIGVFATWLYRRHR